MPPKVEKNSEDGVTQVFVFEKDRMLKKFNVDNFVLRQKIMEDSSKHVVPIKPAKNPSEKLQERLNTYRNVRKMRTDYKNYVRWYGKPSFNVPDEIV